MDVDEDNCFGEGAVFSDFCANKEPLVSTEVIENLDLTSTPVEETYYGNDTFKLLDNITRENLTGAVVLAARTEAQTYSINHNLSITSGCTDDENYLKAVMLLILCRLRILKLTKFQELNLERLEQEGAHLIILYRKCAI